MKPYELFEVLARKTWRSIERFSRNRIHLGEDAITSNNLDALASAGPACVFVEDTRVQESTKGCDFELWIGSSHLGWRRYAVQAKKIQFSTGRYNSLAHKVNGTLQIDILNSYATANRAMALYCFYNHSTEPYKWYCGLSCEVKQFGCSVTPSAVVRAAIAKRGARNYKYMHEQPETVPWRCLVRCPNLLSKPLPKVLPKTAKGPASWPNVDDNFYDALPLPLIKLKTQEDDIPSLDQLGIFNSNSPLRPQWVGIIDVKDESRTGV